MINQRICLRYLLKSVPNRQFSNGSSQKVCETLRKPRNTDSVKYFFLGGAFVAQCLYWKYHPITVNALNAKRLRVSQSCSGILILNSFEKQDTEKNLSVGGVAAKNRML